MRNFSAIGHLLSFAVFQSCVLGSTDLLPGLTYYDGSEKLVGKLIFLNRHDCNSDTNSDNAATIYEFDLVRKKIRKMTESPNGLFIASGNGDVLCVVYRPGNWFRSDDTNVFVYSDSVRQGRTVLLGRPAKNTVVASQHIFFEVENADSSQHVRTTEILDYDISNGQIRPVELPDASEWQYQDYDGVFVVPGRSNIIRFHYKPVGKRLTDGKDYPEGIYDFDITNGIIQRHSDMTHNAYNQRFAWKAFDGQYVFFEGRSGPIHGLKLVTSPWSYSDTQVLDPNREKVKVLHVFSRLPALRNGLYWLDQIAPDGRHVLVRLQEPTTRKHGILPGFVNTYYLISLPNGEARVLLKDTVEQKTIGSLSHVRWVGAGN